VTTGSARTPDQDLLAERDAEFTAAYGFGLPLAVPEYRAAVRGAWSVRSRRGGIGQGYVSEITIEPDFHVLARDGTVWMSTALLERESHAWHLACCAGHVVVAGLGLGVFAAAAAARDTVSHVTVAEIDPDVIALFGECAAIRDPAIRDKIRIVAADADSAAFAEAVRDQGAGGPIGYAYADIWPVYPDPEAAAWTRRWITRLGARRAGYWGQEADGLAIDAVGVTLTLAELGIPTTPTPGYLTFLRDIAGAHGIPDPAG
jgi:threonine dehydrogenase-like Zn-dependent dehydrogenase